MARPQRAKIPLPCNIVSVNGQAVNNKCDVVVAITAAGSESIRLVVSHAIGQDTFELARPGAGCGIDVSDAAAAVRCRAGSAGEVSDIAETHRMTGSGHPAVGTDATVNKSTAYSPLPVTAGGWGTSLAHHARQRQPCLDQSVRRPCSGRYSAGGCHSVVAGGINSSGCLRKRRRRGGHSGTK
jgi:hypothetical protein